MSKEEYAACPEQIKIRLVDINIEQAGFRSKKYTVATTILDEKIYSRDWIANVYRSRWLVELDIRTNQVFTRPGHHPRQDSGHGQNRNLVLLVGLQFDSLEDATELRGQWPNAANVELYDDDAIAGRELGFSKRYT